MEWRIKRYEELTLDELYEICHKRIEVFVCEQHFLCQELDLFDKTCFHVFALFHGKMIAYCRVFQNEKGEWFIGRVLVVQPNRKTGLGLLLMQKAVAHVRSQNENKSIYLHSQCQARPFYEKCGFHAIGDIFDEEGCPHILMVN
ncbi:hypothetical protein EIN_096360 [Entamoeba invadens IP1]|uniref:Glucosamine 6-phosphate N-acetyltransferase n=1 Tax=Entamoeba invadens IP1 TaxID=370355 RepID=A0A0A1U0I1_ENTIV|nr:hypothetical protein EIN_096360 [Entamoeba invadens IP1]ELP87379.1 hypothetical protein EIN_096360 [Entamoeba invadens IP1]|eukprot:XP_004254150.1 hypothetical protein EIN_096360 [Entamoeba invadens IP1]